MKTRRHFILIPLAALVAVLPLLARGTSCGHDFGFHVVSWLEAQAQWRQGVWPRWEFTAAWNAGEPRFVFYPPLSWMLGALAGFVMPWAWVPNFFIWVALTAAGFSMYRLARLWAADGAALIAACFYIVHPYMMFTFYERSAYGELLAAAWIPLLLWAVLRERVSVAGVAVPVALLWLSNDPEAVIGCYLLALLAVLRVAWVWRESWRDAMSDAAKLAAGVVLGLGLAGFYLVPAIVEQRWVHVTMADVPGVRVVDNFLFGHYGGPAHHAILFTASWCAVALLGMMFALGAVAIARRGEERWQWFAVVALMTTGTVTFFLLTAASALLWRDVPELKYLQFPWRLDAFLGAMAAAMLALALAKVQIRLAAVVALAVVVLFSFGGNHLFRQVCHCGMTVRDLRAEFAASDVYYSDDYPPATSDPKAIQKGDSAWWIAAAPNDAAPAGAAPVASAVLADRLHFIVTSAGPSFAIIHLRDYPAWRVVVNDTAIRNRPHRTDGLIVVPVMEGMSKIDIGYAVTDDVVTGVALTIFSCLALTGLYVKRRIV